MATLNTRAFQADAVAVLGYVLLALLFLSLTFPIKLVPIKISLLVLAAGIYLFVLLRGHRLQPLVVMLAFFYAVAGLSWSVYGFLSDNPGALRVLTVSVVYPLVFTAFAATYRGQEHALVKVFFAASLTIAVVDIAFVYSGVFFTGSFPYQLVKHLYGSDAVVDNGQDYLKFTLPNVSSLIFLLPFFICRLCFVRASYSGLFLVLVLLLVALASGRRAIFLVMFLAPLLAFVLTLKPLAFERSSLLRLTTVIAVMGVGGICAYLMWPDYFARTLVSIGNFSTDKSNIERANQFNALMDGFYVSPFFGAGAGAAADYIRSIEQPWAYELSYVAFLFQYGVLGFLIYSAGILFLVCFLTIQARRKGRRSFEFCYLAGFISFLMANATNPYLMKFDYMWVVFIPVALLNWELVKS